MMRSLVLAILMLLPSIAWADDDTARKLAAIPFLAEQRTTAMDGLAVCSGDRAALQKQLSDAKAELEKLKSQSTSPQDK